MVAALLLALFGGTAWGADSAAFAFRAGLGYDFISQRYFLDSVVGSASDTFFQQWAMTTDYLNDVKGILDFRYRPSGARGTEVRALYEQTPDLLRARLSGLWTRSGSTATWLSRGELDWRDRISGNSRTGDDYVLGTGESGVRVRLGDNWAIRSKLLGEFVDFRGATAYAYDYRRLTGKIGFERSLGLLSAFSLDGFISTRQVPDSQPLSYVSVGGEGSLIGLTGSTEIDLYCRLERKNYDAAAHRDDYTGLNATSHLRLGFGGKFFLEPTGQIDALWFDPADPLNNDYFRGRFWLGGGLDWDEITVAIGPEIDILSEQVTADVTGENYFEAGGKLAVDCLLPGRLFASAESSTGHRNVRGETDYLSDFAYERISLLADWTVTSRINLNILAAAEWEWHDVATDDSRLLLISSSLTYSFK
ncbi:hypothetical protein C3F09_00550 [candidate division GN15 bacterium]|uniref:Alginate export domain-containing protein n=1 Tax=candidate division GN15 bacterium TaxID=2072418 RepID=A0A855X4J3_9BACT|nr:MAG: hypothetical protein C3F09_00550 [candidate division GN15 bacterium]